MHYAYQDTPRYPASILGLEIVPIIRRELQFDYKENTQLFY